MKTTLIATIGAVVSLAACDSPEAEPGLDQITTASLPSGADTQNCADTPEAPDRCDWMRALDALYFGDITKIEMVSSPAVLDTAPGTEVTSCSSGVVNHAMEITLAVLETVAGEPHQTVRFRLGVHQLDELDPRPALHPTQGLVWPAGNGLEVGDRIGVPLHQSGDGSWGLMGEPLLTQAADGSVQTQQRSRCQEPVPAGIAGADLSALRTDAESCSPSQEAQFRRAYFDAAWTERRSWAYAALCFDAEDQPMGCVTDSDCPPDTPTCNDGSCG